MPYDVRFHWQAEAALNSLSPHERQRVMAALDRLRASGVRATPSVRLAEPTPTAEESYVLRVADALSVMFTLEPGNVLSVRDIINRNLAVRYG